MIASDLDGFASASGTDAGSAKKWMQSGGWRDLEGQFMVKSSGADRPTFAVTLNGLYGYRWLPTTMQWERTIMIDKDTLAEWGDLLRACLVAATPLTATTSTAAIAPRPSYLEHGTT